MKVAITLAGGKLGSAIAQKLVKEIGNQNVVGIARTPEKAKHLGIEIRKGDYNSREDFNDALKGIDAVLMISGMDHPEKRIQQHRNVIEAAKGNGVRKIVYTSIVGKETGTSFSPVVSSNRQTEQDVKDSGLQWAIGRNGIYIEPDVEYIDTYTKEGGIINSAGEGKCGYISRSELGFAYAKMLLEEIHHGHTYNLSGNPISQQELAEAINNVYGTQLSYTAISAEAYEKERKEALGDFLGSIIAGIYAGIQQGAYDITSDFERTAGRSNKSAFEMIKEIKNSTK
ncbi:MAG: NAD(P)H-binding protein [Bacteroidota bacterium]